MKNQLFVELFLKLFRSTFIFGFLIRCGVMLDGLFLGQSPIGALLLHQLVVGSLNRRIVLREAIS